MRLALVLVPATSNVCQRSGAVTDEVAGELGRNVADLLADVGRGLLLDAQQQLCLDGHLHCLGQAGVDLLEGGRQQPSQEHRCHLLDLSTRQRFRQR